MSQLTSDISRDESIRILDSMGVHFPVDTGLTTETLAMRLKSAIDMAQRVSDLIPKCVDPNTLEDWTDKDGSSPSPRKLLVEVYQQCSMNECAENWFRKEVMGDSTVPLYIDVFSDVRQSLMAMAHHYTGPNRCTIFVVEDAEETYSITFRILGVHALNDETPLLSVLYNHGPGSGLNRSYDFLTSRETVMVPKIKATILEQKLLLYVLGHNSKRIATSFKPERHYTEKTYRVSFLLPLRALTMENIGMLTSSGCARCGVPAVSRCSSCQSVTYCGKECQAGDWKRHKNLCKRLSSGKWQTVRFSYPSQQGSSSLSMVVINKFTMPDEILKQKSTKVDGNTPPPNVHGTSPFIVKIQVPVNVEGENDPMMLIYDRRRSFTGYIMRSTDRAVYTRLEDLVRGSSIWGLKMYRWAKRVGDWTLDICLDVEPSEPVQW